AMKDQTEVCPLSRRGTCPVSRLLQPGIRFFRPPLPAPLTVFLAVHLPVRQRYGFTRFRLTYRGSGRVLSLHRGALRPCAPCARGSNRTPYLMVQACQHLWPVADNGVYQQFTCVNPSACLTARPGRRTTARKHPRILPAAGQRCCSTADGVLSREWCHATTTGDVPVCAGA